MNELSSTASLNSPQLDPALAQDYESLRELVSLIHTTFPKTLAQLREESAVFRIRLLDLLRDSIRDDVRHEAA